MALALRHAATLKPEILLAQAISEYESILKEDQKMKFREHRGQSPPCAIDVLRLTAEIDRDMSSRRGRRCVGLRLTNVLQSVQQFSTVADDLIGIANSHIASAIWGVLKVSIQIASNFSFYFDNLSKLLMEIGSTSPRYQEFGFLYPRSIRLRNALCKYFTEVVKLCKQAIVLISKPFFSQFSSSILFTTEFSRLSGDLQKLAAEIREEVCLASQQAQKDEIETNATFRASTNRLSALELQKDRQRKKEKVKLKLLDACSTYNHERAWKQARKQGTTRWVFEQDIYKKWQEEQKHSGVLWCTGILGSGKTILTANIVEQIIISIPKATVGYFFCKYDDAESLKARAVIGSIARQLLSCLELNVADRIAPEKLGFLDSSQILDYVEQLLPLDQTYFIVLDGIDECIENEAWLVMEYVKRMLTFKHVFRIYCSSRPNVFHWLPCLIQPQWRLLMPEVNPEIAEYICFELEQRMESGELCLGDPNVIISIQDALLKGAQGMYLWIIFQIDSICSQKTDESILNTLRDLPKDLPETFNRVLQKLKQSKDSDPTLCKKVFELVTAAQRPLTLGELRYAVSIVPGDTIWDTSKLINDVQKVVKCCGSFLIVDEEYITVHFIHHSVKQYLLSSLTDLKENQYHVDPIGADLLLGEICVTCLSTDSQLIAIRNVPQIQPKSVSAVLNKASPTVNGTLPQSILSRTLTQSKLSTRMALRLLRSKGSSNYGLYHQSESITKPAQEYRESMEQSGSFVSYAQETWLFHSRNFFPGEVKSYTLWSRLISGSRDVKLSWSKEDWRDLDVNILNWIAKHQHGALLYEIIGHSDSSAERAQKMISFLQEKVPSLGLPGKYYCNAICLAISYPTLDQGVNIDVRTGLWDSVAQLALVSLLLDNGAHIETRGKEYTTALQSTAERPSYTALQLASKKGYKDAVQLLLNRGAKVNAEDSYAGGTALQLASSKGHEAVVRLLLRKGANVNAEGSFASITALQLASNEGHYGVVQLLLDHGANVNAESPLGGGAALQLAANKGHEAVIQLLLNHGAKVNAERLLSGSYGKLLR